MSDKDLMTSRIPTPTRWMVVLALGSLTAGCEETGQTDQPEAQYEIEKEFEKGPLRVTVKLEKSQINIADTLAVSIETVVDENYRVSFPVLANDLDEYEFNILDHRVRPQKLLTERRILYRSDYRLEPVLSGFYTLPELTFTFREQLSGEEDATAPPSEHELRTVAIEIEVTSPLDDEQADLTPAAIKDIVGVHRPFNAAWLWVGGIVIALALAAIVLFLRARRQAHVKKRIYKTAHQLAHDRLSDLEVENLPAQGRIKEFYERISYILRWYIEHRFDLKAPERTTEEFLHEAAAQGALNAGHTVKLWPLIEMEGK